MTDEERVVGWLCMARFNHDFDINAMMPDGVVMAGKALGYLSQERGKSVALTDKAVAACDLAAPEWGIELLWDENEG